jgi:hypothetical protein
MDAFGEPRKLSVAKPSGKLIQFAVPDGKMGELISNLARLLL